MMPFFWPWFLILLLLVPILAAVYWWILRRKRRFAVRYSSLSLIREALPKRPRWRQHLPFILFLLALSSLIVSLARPFATVKVPLSRTTIILALDVSRSMCAIDVPPNRLTVAQDAALAFIEDQAEGTQIGIVAFAGFAEIVVPPTRDKEALQNAVVNLTTSIGTAIGSATLKSIDAIAEINNAIPPSAVDLQVEENGREQEIEDYEPDIIVLLTDGANSRGPFPLDAAQKAADRGIRVYTIGFGTAEPQRMVCTREQLGSDAFIEDFGGGPGSGSFTSGGFGDFRRFLIIDEETLQTIAEMTGGDYFRAEDSQQLLEIFLGLPAQVELQEEELEISVVFAALGALFLLVSLLLTMRWNRYP
jgi:Ca-activated chloride channel homolog